MAYKFQFWAQESGFGLYQLIFLHRKSILIVILDLWESILESGKSILDHWSSILCIGEQFLDLLDSIFGHWELIFDHWESIFDFEPLWVQFCATENRDFQWCIVDFLIFWALKDDLGPLWVNFSRVHGSGKSWASWSIIWPSWNQFLTFRSQFWAFRSEC